MRTRSSCLSTVSRTGADSTKWAERITQAEAEFTAALEDDLNTARAVAPIFELLRFCNGHLDKTGNTASAGDIAATLALLEKFDSIFAILEDRDRFAGRHVVTIVCGSNVDVDTYHRWVGAAPVHRS